MFQIVWQGIKLVMTDIILPLPEDQYTDTYVISIWHTCNQHLHNETQRYNQSSLESAIQQIFHKAEQHRITAFLIQDQTPESILDDLIKFIQTWTKCSTTIMHDLVTAAATQAKLNTQDIRSFFSTITNTQNPPGANASNKNLL